ncbi:MAG: hypothetical protein AAFY72_14580 [Cyanobacteria bacterium J06649_4]
MNNAATTAKPAEQALFKALTPEHLHLVAGWLREELTLNEQEYTSQATRSQARIEFIAKRLDEVARRIEASKSPTPEDATEERPDEKPEETSTPNPTSDLEEERPWRFSDEYWERYESDSD